MPQFRQRMVLGVAVLAAAGWLGVRGYGQTAAPARAIVDRTGPSAIERGISPIATRTPGSLEELRRLSIQTATRAADRIGRSGAA
jgi:hypothetical protein